MPLACQTGHDKKINKIVINYLIKQAKGRFALKNIDKSNK